jgi:GTP-binding protein HflX
MTYDTKTPRPKAVLVSVMLPGTTDGDNIDSLAELKRLASTLGFDTLTTISQRRSAVSSGSVFGEGKLKELAKITGGTGIVNENREGEEQDESVSGDFPKEKATVVIFDGELSPSQLTCLQSATGAEVFDRTGIIVEIFSRHAKTRESKLQVEIARLNYLSPRARAVGGATLGDRVEGKVGETKLELDRRKIRDRVSELRQELIVIQKEQSIRRKGRSDQPRVALVGYTNAGKSSLMRALTGSDVLVEDKLFATLDTTVRALYPESKPKVLISDTVGFIKKLPHDLVASFRSTLEEAANASLLLFVVDASDATFRSQLEVTNQVLNEIGVKDVPQKLVLNKIDKLDLEKINALLEEFPNAIAISTLNPKDIQQLRESMISFFEEDMVDAELFIPYQTQGAVGEIRNNIRVLHEDYDDNGIHLKVRAPQKYLNKLKNDFNI